MNATETQNGYYREWVTDTVFPLLLSWCVPNIRQVRGKTRCITMHENADMQVINLHTAVEQAYKMGYEDGSEDVDEPLLSLSHMKENNSWLLNTRQTLMGLSGMSRDGHTGLHNGHSDVGVICDGYDSRDRPIPIEVTNTRYTYDTVMSAYGRGFVNKCKGNEQSIPNPDEL